MSELMQLVQVVQVAQHAGLHPRPPVEDGPAPVLSARPTRSHVL